MDHDGLRPAFMTPALLPSCANSTSAAAVHIASQEARRSGGQRIMMVLRSSTFMTSLISVLLCQATGN